MSSRPRTGEKQAELAESPIDPHLREETGAGKGRSRAEDVDHPFRDMVISCPSARHTMFIGAGRWLPLRS